MKFMKEAMAVRAAAEQELANEQFRAAVEAEKVRLRTHKTWRQRFTAWLPFTITWKNT